MWSCDNFNQLFGTIYWSRSPSRNDPVILKNRQDFIQEFNLVKKSNNKKAYDFCMALEPENYCPLYKGKIGYFLKKKHSSQNGS